MTLNRDQLDDWLLQSHMDLTNPELSTQEVMLGTMWLKNFNKALNEAEVSETSVGAKFLGMLVVVLLCGFVGFMVGQTSRAAYNSSSANWKLTSVQTDINDIKRKLDSISRQLP